MVRKYIASVLVVILILSISVYSIDYWDDNPRRQENKFLVVERDHDLIEGKIGEIGNFYTFPIYITASDYVEDCALIITSDIENVTINQLSTSNSSTINSGGTLAIERTFFFNETGIYAIKFELSCDLQRGPRFNPPEVIIDVEIVSPLDYIKAENDFLRSESEKETKRHSEQIFTLTIWLLVINTGMLIIGIKSYYNDKKGTMRICNEIKKIKTEIKNINIMKSGNSQEIEVLENKNIDLTDKSKEDLEKNMDLTINLALLATFFTAIYFLVIETITEFLLYIFSIVGLSETKGYVTTVFIKFLLLFAGFQLSYGFLRNRIGKKLSKNEQHMIIYIGILMMVGLIIADPLGMVLADIIKIITS